MQNLALNNAQAYAPLTVLPAFSHCEKDDKLTATQWLQKFCLLREGAEYKTINSTNYLGVVKQGPCTF